jgi:hypothetical protein
MKRLSHKIVHKSYVKVILRRHSSAVSNTNCNERTNVCLVTLWRLTWTKKYNCYVAFLRVEKKVEERLSPSLGKPSHNDCFDISSSSQVIVTACYLLCIQLSVLSHVWQIKWPTDLESYSYFPFNDLRLRGESYPY